MPFSVVYFLTFKLMPYQFQVGAYVLEILESESKKVLISVNENCNSSGFLAIVHSYLLLVTFYADTKPMVSSSLDSHNRIIRSWSSCTSLNVEHKTKALKIIKFIVIIRPEFSRKTRQVRKYRT